MKASGTTILSVILVAAIPVSAQGWKYPGCADVTDADFKQTVLVGRTGELGPKVTDAGLTEPMEMDLLDDGAGGVDVYFTQRTGELKYYDASENKVKQLGKFAVSTVSDCGLKGIALAKDFNTSGWIYLYSCPSSANPQAVRIARVTVVGGQVDMASERIIWQERANYSTKWHNGGSMKFDAYGDLWAAIGKNSPDDPNSFNSTAPLSNTEFSSANTANGRGSVIRLTPIAFPDGQKPEPGLGRTFNVPKGNFGDYYSMLLTKEGKQAQAEEYRNPQKVYPEIYVKGVRNPWTLNLDTRKRTLVWGENGVNRSGKHEEHNYTRIPGFFGYPYFAGHPDVTGCDGGGQQCYAQTFELSGQMVEGSNAWGPMRKDPKAPVNNFAGLTGVRNLPPAIPAVHAYQRSSAMTGPIYSYDPDSKSTVRFPPHFHDNWLVWDFKRGYRGDGNGLTGGFIKWLKVEGTPPRITQTQDFMKNQVFYSVLESEFGPDGALYGISYAGWFNSSSRTSLWKVEYAAASKCHPARLAVPDRDYYPPAGYGCTTPGHANFDASALAHDEQACLGSVGTADLAQVPGAVRLFGNTLMILQPGKHSVVLFNLKGERVGAFAGSGAKTYALPSAQRGQALLVRIRTARGLGIYRHAVM